MWKYLACCVYIKAGTELTIKLEWYKVYQIKNFIEQKPI